MAYEVVKRLKQKMEFKILKILSDGVQQNERTKGKQHQVFRLSFDAKVLKEETEIVRVLDYIHHNPVSKKWHLIDNYLDYPYSSASFYEHEKRNEVNLWDYRNIFSESLIR